MIGRIIENKPSQKNNIHDKLFKQSLKHKQVALDLIKNVLPKKLFNIIDTNNLNIYQNTFVTEEHREIYSDMVLKLKLIIILDIYILCEHQSTNDEFMGLRFLEYNLSIMR